MAIFKRGKIYWIDYYVQGRRRREKIGTSYRLAVKVEAKRKHEIAEGKFLDIRKIKKITFSDFLATKYIPYARNKLTSWDTEKSKVKILNDYFGKRLLHQISNLDIEGYRIQQLDHNAPSSANKHMYRLKNIFKKAILWKYVEKNPVDGMEKLKEDNERTRFFETQEEFNRALLFMPTELKPLVIVDVNTGLRAGELLSLTWPDIHYRSNNICVRKRKKSETRYVPMNSIVIDTLSKLTRSVTVPNVFRWTSGKPIKSYKDSFGPALERAGIKDFHFHDLRHTFGSWCAMANVPLITIAYFMGHKTLNQVKRYAHLSDQHRHDEIEKIVGEQYQGGRQDAPYGHQCGHQNVSGGKVDVGLESITHYQTGT